MTINQVQLANTFDNWRVATNQLITIANDLKEGNLLSSGTISLSNPTGYSNNVTLNVQFGMIYGDAGLLSNVGKPASITNQKLQNNSITITPTQGQIVLSNTIITLGSMIYLNVANLVTVNTDTSIANIASANLVNSVHVIATRADLISNAAYNRANAVNAGMQAAFALANTSCTNLAAACTAISLLGASDISLNANTSAAFTRANVAIANVNYTNTAMQAAFATANIAIANVNYTNTAMQRAFATANIAIANVNYTNTSMQQAFATANGGTANASAAFARANASVNTIAYSQSSGSAWGVHSVIATGRRTINFRDSANISVSVQDDSTLGFANVTFLASNVLPNAATQAGATFTGNLTVIGGVTAINASGNAVFRDTRTGTQYDVRQASLLSPAGATSATAQYILSNTDAGRFITVTCGTISIPSGNAPAPRFDPGDTVRIYNRNNSSILINVYPGANVVQANNNSITINAVRNLGPNGLATITCVSANIFVLEGHIF